MPARSPIRANIRVNCVPDTEAAIEALEDHPHVEDASPPDGLSTTPTRVDVIAYKPATSVSVGGEQLTGTVEGQLNHHDISYGVGMADGEKVRLLISQKASPEDKEAYNEGEAL